MNYANPLNHITDVHISINSIYSQFDIMEGDLCKTCSQRPCEALAYTSELGISEVCDLFS